MPTRQYPGGISPFPTQHRPSIFNRLPPEEFIERRGEPVLWFINMPAPTSQSALNIPGMLSMPGQSENTPKGYALGFQRSYRIAEETLAIQHHDLSNFTPAYSPIHKAHSAFVYRTELQGGNIQLEIDEVARNTLSILPNDKLQYWHEIRLDYEALLFETRTFVFEKTNTLPLLNLRRHRELITDSTGERLINVCVGVKRVSKLDANDSKTPITIEPVTHDFTRIYLPETENQPAVYELEIDIYYPIAVGYSTLTARKNQETIIPIQAGDLEAVVSPYYPLNAGDLIVMTRAQGAAKELVHKQQDGRFYLKYGPIISIDKIYARQGQANIELDLSEAQIDGFHSFNIVDKQIANISVAYSYHPQYRVKERLDFSALEGRRQPVKWRLSPEHSNLVFG